jgi:hypothetical protein
MRGGTLEEVGGGMRNMGSVRKGGSREKRTNKNVPEWSRPSSDVGVRGQETEIR